MVVGGMQSRRRRSALPMTRTTATGRQSQATMGCQSQARQSLIHLASDCWQCWVLTNIASSSLGRVVFEGLVGPGAYFVPRTYANAFAECAF